MLGLMGDSVDNIPGIPGIGPKTAAKLLAAYGSVEGLIENAEQLKGKQKERVGKVEALAKTVVELGDKDVELID